MKRLMKVTGFLAGLGAAVWLMRDRLISLALPREPEPPTFRVDAAPAADDLTVISGVGDVFASRLRQHGITTLQALAQANPVTLAEQLDAPLSRVEGWIAEAAQRSAVT
ncbi:MAG: hypothetical protein GWP04_06675 [Gammaproteobacteria bacterium]|nr:hypothetical protein [Gammaproteobacteria bacterium]